MVKEKAGPWVMSVIVTGRPAVAPAGGGLAAQKPGGRLPRTASETLTRASGPVSPDGLAAGFVTSAGTLPSCDVKVTSQSRPY